VPDVKQYATFTVSINLKPLQGFTCMKLLGGISFLEFAGSDLSFKLKKFYWQELPDLLTDLTGEH
jgi:hypothetical protein